MKLFAAARDAAGAGEVVFELADGATIVDVERALLKEVPGLAQIVSQSRWALDAEFCRGDALVAAGSEIALIPPVSGG